MKIRIDSHTLERAMERGTNEDEIIDVLHAGFDIPAKKGRRGKARIFDFTRKRLDVFYEQKKVEVIYTIEDDTIITITVYVFYGRWQETR